jgi:hypothetical protein
MPSPPAPSGRVDPPGGWRSALVALVALYLLTLPLTWLVTDQAEMLLSARRLLERGTLTLADDGTRVVSDAPWAPRRPGEPVRSRLHPGTAVVLAPLLLLDKATGLEDRANLGTLVHLQGVLFVTATLALLAAALERLGASAASTALALLLVGASWPVWQMARNGGAEPVLALLLAIWVTATACARRQGQQWQLLWARALVLVLLPWVHPTGAVLAVALSAATLLRGGAPARSAAVLLGAATLGCLSLALLWNLGYHGHLVAGGYTLVGGERFFGATQPLLGLQRMLADLLRMAPLPLLLLALAAMQSRGSSLRELREPLLMAAALLALFASYYQQDTARRFSAVLLTLVLPVGLAAERLPWRFPARQLTVAVALGVGAAWFMHEAGHYYQGPDGLFYPSVWWVKLAIDHGVSAAWVVPLLLLLGLLAAAWVRTSGVLSEPARSG